MKASREDTILSYGRNRCELYKENDRMIVFKCDDGYAGTDKPLVPGLKRGIFSVRNGANNKGVKKALKDIGGIENYIHEGDDVYIKTEFSRVAPSPSPDVLKSVIKAVKKAGGKPSLIDNDTSYRKFTNDLVSNAGYYKILKKQGVPVHNVSGSEKVTFESNGKKFKVPKFLMEDNAKIINISTFKHDLISGVSLGQKNMIDLAEIDEPYEHDLDDMISTVHKVIRPDITILDGSRTCLSANPLFCERADNDFILTSNDTVCADAWGSKMLFTSVENVGHIIKSEELGVGDTKCMEAKKSKSPISVADGRWKTMAPDPNTVEQFSSAYKLIGKAVGGKMADSLWANTLIPIFHDIRNKK